MTLYFNKLQENKSRRKKVGRKRLKIGEGGRKKGGGKKPGCHRRGRKYETNQERKKGQLLEKLATNLQKSGNPYDDMSIDEKKRHAIYTYNYKMKVHLYTSI